MFYKIIKTKTEIFIFYAKQGEISYNKLIFQNIFKIT